MKNKTTLDTELVEFFVLGFLLFAVLFGIFASKLIIFQSGFNVLYKDIPLPNSDLEKIKAPKIFKSRPSITSIDDSKTPCNYNDDVVNYNTSYYSMVLPYNLPFYANKKGTNKAVKTLVEAHEQLHRQLLKNKLIENDIQNDTYNQMLSILKAMQKEQNDIYLFVNSKDNDLYKEEHFVLPLKINNLRLKNAELLVITNDTVDFVFSNYNGENNLPYDEAVIIIDQINDHIVMLNNKTISNYYTVVHRKGFDIKTYKQPVVTNIIERLEYNLKKINSAK